MAETFRPLCDVVACGRPAAGSHLDAALGRSVKFAVCDEHLSRLQAGQRPTILMVLSAGLDDDAREGRPALLFPSERDD